MEHCKTCRWWGVEPEQGIRGDQPSDGTNFCGNPGIAFSEDSGPVPIGGASILDGSGFWGAIVTHDEFGCVRHEPTPPRS